MIVKNQGVSDKLSSRTHLILYAILYFSVGFNFYLIVRLQRRIDQIECPQTLANRSPDNPHLTEKINFNRQRAKRSYQVNE